MSVADRRSGRIGWAIWGGLLLLGVTMVAAVFLASVKARRASAQHLPTYGQIADFALTNETGSVVSLTDLRGRVWIADIIFTRCPGPCLGMTRQMKELQDALPPDSQAKLVTLTTDPDFDTPAVLRAYAERFKADPGRWTFLTGTKSEIAKLAIDSLKLTAVEKKAEERESPQDLFVHSTIFVIADKLGQLRGVFETVGEGIDPRQVQAQLLAAVRELERES